MKTNLTLLGIPHIFMNDLGRFLSQTLDMYYLDALELYKFDLQPRTMEDILESYGEEVFRNQESKTVKYSSTFYNTLIVVDSGAVKNEESMQKLKENTTIIYVEFSIKDVLLKINSETFNSEIIEKFYKLNEKEIKLRTNIMKKYADIVVDAQNGSVERICSNIVNAIKKFFK